MKLKKKNLDYLNQMILNPIKSTASECIHSMALHSTAQDKTVKTKSIYFESLSLRISSRPNAMY